MSNYSNTKRKCGCSNDSHKRKSKSESELSMLSMTHFISSMGCAWNTNDGKATCSSSSSSSTSDEKLSVRKFSYPSFSLSHDGQEQEQQQEQQQEQEENENSVSTTAAPRREDVQSMASNLMARKVVLVGDKDKDAQQDHPEQDQPQRIMLENFLDSFDQLVDARIRAYARILANHVQVLSEANNTRGAQIAEYKLQTLLEFAANNVQFDSTSTDFCVITDENATEDVDGGTEETRLTLPIELTVEIHSVRFHDPTTATATTRSSTQGKQEEEEETLIFKAKGEVRADRILIGGNSNSFENIQIDIDCDILLSQMMEQASNVVNMAVELTNLAWTNNTQKQQELNMMSSSSLTNNNNNNTVNIIADDDEEEEHAHELDHTSRKDSSSSVESMDNFVTYLAPTATTDTAATTAIFTNLDVVHQDTERKSRRDFVSVDLTVESSLQECPTEDTTDHFHGHDHDHDHDHDNKGVNDDLLEEYYKITAERACSIVDFAFATLPPSNKKPRIEY